MFRIKLGQSTTIGNITKGPGIVLECDHVNEIVDLICSGIVHTMIDIDKEKTPDARETIRSL